MSRSRIDLIGKAFAKMDTTGDGNITVDDLKGSYDVSHHKKFVNGEWTKERCLKEFLDSFQIGEKDDKVTVNVRYHKPPGRARLCYRRQSK